MTTQTGQQAPAVTSNLPPPDPDEARYEALRKELGIEAEGQEPEPQAEPEQQREPEPQAEPEQQREPEPKTEPEPAADQHVPRAEHENVQKALKEAREQAKAAEQRFAKALEVLGQRSQPAPQEQKKEEPPKIPSELEDPIGHFKAVNAQLQARIEQIERGSQQTAQQLQADQQARQFMDVVIRAEQEINDPKSQSYKADYWDAVSHLEAQRVAELAAMYPDNSPYAAHQAQQMGLGSVADLRAAVLANDKQAVAIQALQMGISPAEFYYRLAHTRGYTPKPAQQPADKGKQQIEAAKRGKAASVSLSGGEGRKGTNDMSLSDLAEMAIEAQSDPEAAKQFEVAWEAMRKQGKLG